MLVTNLWGGPGAGKSTVAAELFVLLRKHTNANVELTNEFATELCFERAKENLEDQIYLLGQQWHRLWRLDKLGVDVAVCDAPLGIGIPHIRKRKPAYFEKYEALVKALYDEYPNVNILIDRDVYAVGGFKGNKPGKANAWLHDLDRQIREVANPIKTVLYSLTAGQEVFDYVLPAVEGYMGSKAEHAKNR
jgi:hypothetical protein